MEMRVKKKIKQETGKHVDYTSIINNQMRFAIIIGKDNRLEITLSKKDLSVTKSEIVKRHYKQGNLGGFSARIEDPEKKQITPVTEEYQDLYNQVINIIKEET